MSKKELSGQKSEAVILVEEEVSEAPRKSSSGEPLLFEEARETYGDNVNHWPIWVKTEYAAWKDGTGPAPSGGLPADLKKPKAK